ncbi:LysR family transcriptional regulator [Pectobacterium parmentieri]|uniref:LysR family transcriptional regulator n=1 Tax=Pectobacterium parmentieri TaxID=1905730 RepID=A0A0H3I6S6_PECPM|nr:LysR family transcriptional regulator [Pectobacterium parmentieri]AFI91237.1 LysR family transcriptional regulator YbhD [Pectobacterium parmentieri]MBI0470867.1 LysR family transcriptional regulator [Pectobacterium parmentieri]MBI0493572.1 LysR family transcriptional regulator [Pectobacterium parmentieri]MBI0548682.1 LysR family transcriptional regulator [Pectobacterium parmentieri]MBI0554186.1 LysR family transcriptional regulator [Pectobacterium parmentieri]
MNLSIKQLRAFIALTETDNFTRAAQKINLSQPAFSSLIAGLEEEVGYRLFDRDTRKVQLNADGLHFIDIARRLVQTHDDAVGEIKSYATGYKGKIVLAVLPSMAVEWLPQVLTQYHRAYPKIKVELLDTQWDRCLKAVLDGHADLALTAGQPSPGTFSSRMLFADSFYLICHNQHPLAQRANVDVVDVVQYPFVGFCKGTSIRQYTDQLIEPEGFNYVLEVRQLTTMMGLVAANYGVSIVTGLTLFQFQHKDIAIIPFRDLSLQRGIYLVTDKERQLSVCAKEFYDFLLERAESFVPAT